MLILQYKRLALKFAKRSDIPKRSPSGNKLNTLTYSVFYVYRTVLRISELEARIMDSSVENYKLFFAKKFRLKVFFIKKLEPIQILGSDAGFQQVLVRYFVNRYNVNTL